MTLLSPAIQRAPARVPGAVRAAVAFAGAVALALVVGCEPVSYESPAPQSSLATNPAEPVEMPRELATATFGGGCFWCTEAVFLRLKGVDKVVSGYMGGDVENPTYEQVCTGLTGHAECIQVAYDPAQVSYEDLLEVFWKTHDPTTLNRQGFDEGTQYRSVVFYHDDEQKELAEKWKKKLDESGIFSGPIVTEIAEASTFYPAEDYHQEYYAKNPSNRYCQVNIEPKYAKLEKLFADRLKPEDAQR